MKNELQSQNWLFKVDPHSTFRNNFPQPTWKDQQTFLLRDKLITQGEMRETSNETMLANVVRHIEGFCILFRRLYSRVDRWPADSL